MNKVTQAYQLLGIANDAPLREVTRAYRQLAKKYHPDSNPGAGDKAHAMMMRINDAYHTIREYLALGEGVRAGTFRSTSMNHETVSQGTKAGDTWRREWEKQARERHQREQQAREQRRREQDAWAKWWEKRLEERQREDEDLKTYHLVMKHTFATISELYEQRLHYPHIRERPIGSIAYETFLGKYGVLVEKSGKLSQTARSKQFRKKFGLLLEFLEIFLEHLEDVIVEREPRSSAVHRFGKAKDECDKFLGRFFSDIHFDRDAMIGELKRILGSFEEFIEQYPSSPLIFSADLTIDLLRRLYRAFLKD